jgi:hypothetical protein
VTGVYFQPAPAEDSHRKLSVIPSPAADINAKLVFEIVLKRNDVGFLLLNQTLVNCFMRCFTYLRLHSYRSSELSSSSSVLSPEMEALKREIIVEVRREVDRAVQELTACKYEILK